MSNIVETQVERSMHQLGVSSGEEQLTSNCPTPSIPHPPQRVPIDYHTNPILPSSPIPQRSHQVADYSIHSASNIIVEVA